MTSKSASLSGPVTPAAAGRGPVELHQVPPETRLTPSGWRLDILLISILVVVTVTLMIDWRPILATDIWVRDLGSEHRPYWPDTIAINLERLGQGGPLAFLCFVISLVLSWRRKTIEPAIPIVFAFLLSYGTIGTIKVFTDRPMPYRGSVELFTAPHQLAYPSGHASNGVLWYGMLLLLLGHLMWPWLRTFVRWFPPIVVGFTTVYLGHHWVTDVIAGMAIGLVIERVVRRNLWREVPWLMRILRLEPKDPSSSSREGGIPARSGENPDFSKDRAESPEDTAAPASDPQVGSTYSRRQRTAGMSRRRVSPRRMGLSGGRPWTAGEATKDGARTVASIASRD